MLKSTSIVTQIDSIESQLEVLKGMVGRDKPHHRKSSKSGLIHMKGILKNKGKFTESDIENVLIRYTTL